MKYNQLPIPTRKHRVRITESDLRNIVKSVLNETRGTHRFRTWDDLVEKVYNDFIMKFGRRAAIGDEEFDDKNFITLSVENIDYDFCVAVCNFMARYGLQLDWEFVRHFESETTLYFYGPIKIVNNKVTKETFYNKIQNPNNIGNKKTANQQIFTGEELQRGLPIIIRALTIGDQYLRKRHFTEVYDDLNNALSTAVLNVRQGAISVDSAAVEVLRDMHLYITREYLNEVSDFIEKHTRNLNESIRRAIRRYLR